METEIIWKMMKFKIQTLSLYTKEKRQEYSKRFSS